MYADVNSKTGQLQSSHVKVGRANPRKAGLQFHLRPQGDQALGGEFVELVVYFVPVCMCASYF